MADLVQTAANVRPGTDSVRSQVIAGETITAGQPVYLKSTDSKYYKADANAGVSESTVAGIALTNASANDQLVIQTGGEINLGATLTVGTIYVLSGTAGAIAPHGDLVTGWYCNILGIAISTSILDMGLQHSPVAHA